LEIIGFSESIEALEMELRNALRRIFRRRQNLILGVFGREWNLGEFPARRPVLLHYSLQHARFYAFIRYLRQLFLQLLVFGYVLL
jgi:hypothetical protein